MTTATGEARPTIGGTLPYMAREALSGDALDARSDVFAFGVCCYRLVVGGFPTPRRAVVDVGRLPAALPARALIARMLDAERGHRPYMPEVVTGFERAFAAS